MLNNLFNLPENRAISFQSIWGAGDTFAFTTESGAAIDEIIINAHQRILRLCAFNI
jgi:hypothetical protein